MRHFSLFLFLFMLSSGCLAQKKIKEIFYFFPDSVEVKVHNYILSYPTGHKVYFYLTSTGKDTFDLYSCGYNKTEKKYVSKWIFASSRKAFINGKKYPLLIDYDYRFGTTNVSEIGVFGDRADKLRRTFSAYHCFHVKFTQLYILDDNNKIIGYANKQKGEIE